MLPKKVEDALRRLEPKWHPNRFKATLIALPILAIVIPLLLLAMPYLPWFNDMAVQPKGKSQGTYGVYFGETRIVERAPPPGTIPMNYFPYHIEGNDEASAKQAEATLVNPLEATLAVQQRGQKLFNVYCIVCHGPRADGDGEIVGPDLFPAPPSLHSKQAKAFKDGRIFHVISRGQNKMPPYADRIAQEDRWAIVHYVRALQKAKDMIVEEAQR